MPEVPNNREGPQAREPSKCLNGQKYGERLAKEALLSPATRGAKTNKQTKNSVRAITPAAEAVRVPAYLMSQGSPQAKQLHHLHTQPSMGQSCYKQKSLVSMHTGSLWWCLTLCNLWTVAFSIRGILQARILERIGQYWLSYPSRAYFLLP